MAYKLVEFISESGEVIGPYGLKTFHRSMAYLEREYREEQGVTYPTAHGFVGWLLGNDHIYKLTAEEYHFGSSLQD